MKLSPMAEDIFFIRHGQHLPSPNDQPVHEDLGLTPTGILEARTVGLNLIVNPEVTLAYGFNKARSLGTLALCMYPEATIAEISNMVSDKPPEASGIYALDELDYLTPPEGAFMDALYASYARNENFLFLVHESDSYYEQKISSYTVIAGETAKLLRQASNQVKADSNSQFTTALVCPREFYLPCLRAKLSSLLISDTSRDDYVKWYTENVEAKDEARTDIVRIKTTQAGDVFQLEDGHGEMSFSLDAIDELISEYRLLSEII